MDADAGIATIASRQQGVFTRAQARQAGATPGQIRHRLSSGRWQRAQLGVFRLAGTTPSWSQDLFAGWLAAGPEAVVSHSSAAVLLEMSCPAVPMEVTVPAGRRPRPAGIKVHRAAALDRVDRTTLDGLAVTTATRTLIDIAATRNRAAVAAALDHCLGRHLTSVPYVRRRLLALGARGRPGARLLTDLLDARPSDRRAPESEFERRLLALLASLPGPAPLPQYEVVLPGGRTARLDAAYPDVMLGIEADSYVHHFECHRLVGGSDPPQRARRLRLEDPPAHLGRPPPATRGPAGPRPASPQHDTCPLTLR